MSAVDTPAALALEDAAPRVEGVGTAVSTQKSAITLFIHIHPSIVHGFKEAYSFLTEIKMGLVVPACLVS